LHYFPERTRGDIRTNGLNSLVAELRETVEQAESRKVSV